MAFIAIIAGMIHVNLILIRNCSIFVSVKIYPAICNYSLFKKLNGNFEFTRDVPSALPFREPIDFERRRRSQYEKKISRRNESLQLEMESLNKEKDNENLSSENILEVVVKHSDV